MHGKTLYRTVSGALVIFLLFVLSAVPVMAAESACKNEQQSWADRDRFPEAYSILTSDRVMFPDDISDWPLKIDSTHQLFVDDYLISEIEHLTRRFHQPAKHPENPLIGGGSPGVLYDKNKGLFRMWSGVRYFTSTDGVHWEKPDLGPNGNQVFSESGDLRGFMYNPDLPEYQGRYKVVLERRTNKDINEPGGFYLYHSRDGLHWQRRPERPILQRTLNNMTPCAFRPMGVGVERGFQWNQPDHVQSCGVGDTSSFRYDSVLKRYIFDGKFNLYFPQADRDRLGIVSTKPHLRLRTFSESDDMIHWSPPRFLMFPDRLDPPDRQIYAHVGFVYESMWIGIIQAMGSHGVDWKQVDLHLSYSRDGRHWLRSRQRQPFIPLGGPDSWDPDYSGTAFTGPVLVGDKLYFYYFGSRNSKRDKTGKRFWPTYIGLAILRQDGFASLDASQDIGQITTRPITFNGKKLFVNADIEKGGWVKAAVLTRDLKPVELYTLDDSTALTKDTTKGRMSWKSKKDLVLPGDGYLRLVFQLKNAKLYSFWIE